MRNPDCTSCELHKTCQHVCMWGDGPKRAQIMLVGEAPGKDEDHEGKPFIGKAGRLLSSLLQEFGINRSDVYIANAVKCRPPSNRTPKRQEISVCRRYLTEEIKAVQPRLIIAMGGTAIRSITGNHRLSVATARTSKFRYFDAAVRTTFHPASVFRVPYNLKLMQEDFARFLGRSLPERHESARIQNLLRPNELASHLKRFAQKGNVVVDIETNGLDPFKKDSQIWTVGFCTEPGISYVVPIYHREGNNPDPERSLQEISTYLLENKNVRVIGHNVKFDLKWLMQFGCKVKCKVFDTMVAMHLLDENYPNKGLKHLAQIHTDMGDYSKVIKDMQKKKDHYPDFHFPLEEMVRYNGDDCDATLRLFKIFWGKLKDEGLLSYMRFQMEVLKTFAEMEVQGVEVDQSQLNVLVKEYTKALKEQETKIRKDLGPINLDSPKQIGQALYVTKGLRPPKLTDGGAPSTDNEALSLLKDPVAKLLIERRKTSKVLNTYLYGNAAKITDDGRIHTDYHLASSREGEDRGGTVTGRPSSDMQQIPKVGGIKSMFVSRWNDGLICSADYSQIELRVMAHFSRDPAMLEAFRDRDADIHLSVASKVYGKPESEITKLERSHVKAINFGIIYCIGPNKLADQIGCSVHRAKQFMEQWFETYPLVRKYIRSQEMETIQKGFVTTLFGRKRRLIGASRADSIGRAIIRQGVNTPIQGSAVDLTLLGMVLMNQRLQRYKMRSKIILSVHDSVVFDVYPGEQDALAEMIPQVFEQLPTEEVFGVKLLVPLKIDVAFGRTWQECEEYEPTKKKVDKKVA